MGSHHCRRATNRALSRRRLPQEELPELLAQMDVCTLPYAFGAKRNHYANPTKVREYLAAGRAVVATRNNPACADIDGAVDHRRYHADAYRCSALRASHLAELADDSTRPNSAA